MATGLGLAGAALVGCGGDDDGGGAAATASAVTTAATTPKPGAKLKDTIVSWYGTDPSGVDPHKSSGAPEAEYARLAYSNGLVRWDFDLQIKGDLASGWDVSPDGLTYTFHLRPNLKFSNGKPLDAAMVVQNLEAVLDKKYASFLQPDWAIVKKVEAVGATDVKLTLQQPSSVLLAVVAHRTMIADMASFKPDTPVGAGPWILSDWVRGSHMLYKKNPDYWNASHILAQTLKMPFGSDINARYNALRTGEVDLSGLDTTFVKQQQQSKELVLYNTPGSAHRIIPLVKKGYGSPFEDLRVRQAIDLAISRDNYVAGVTDGLGFSTVGPFYKGHPYFTDLPIPKQDVAKATALIKEAGLAGTTIKMPNYTTSAKWGELFQSDMKAIGLNITLVPGESAAIFTNNLFCTKPQADGSLLMCDATLLNTGWSNRVDPDQEFYPKFYTGGPHNRGGYSNPEVDKLLDDARKVTAVADRKKLYDQVQQILRRDLPWIYTYYTNTFWASTKRVKGFNLHQGDGALHWYEDVAVEQA